MSLHLDERIALATGLSTVVLSGVFGYRKAEVQIFLMLSLLALIVVGCVLLIYGLFTAKRTRVRAFSAFTIALVCLVVSGFAPQAGREVRDWQFKRQLPHYEWVVARFADGTFRLRSKIPEDSLPPAIRTCCYILAGWRDSTGALVVEFWTDGGFPVKHSGWLYYSGDTVVQTTQFVKVWPKGYRIADHWYRVRD